MFVIIPLISIQRMHLLLQLTAKTWGDELNQAKEWATSPVPYSKKGLPGDNSALIKGLFSTSHIWIHWSERCLSKPQANKL